MEILIIYRKNVSGEDRKELPHKDYRYVGESKSPCLFEFTAFDLKNDLGPVTNHPSNDHCSCVIWFALHNFLKPNTA